MCFCFNLFNPFSIEMINLSLLYGRDPNIRLDFLSAKVTVVHLHRVCTARRAFCVCSFNKIPYTIISVLISIKSCLLSYSHNCFNLRVYLKKAYHDINVNIL